MADAAKTLRNEMRITVPELPWQKKRVSLGGGIHRIWPPEGHERKYYQSDIMDIMATKRRLKRHNKKHYERIAASQKNAVPWKDTSEPDWGKEALDT